MSHRYKGRRRRRRQRAWPHARRSVCRVCRAGGRARKRIMARYDNRVSRHTCACTQLRIFMADDRALLLRAARPPHRASRTQRLLPRRCYRLGRSSMRLRTVHLLYDAVMSVAARPNFPAALSLQPSAPRSNADGDSWYHDTADDIATYGIAGRIWYVCALTSGSQPTCCWRTWTKIPGHGIHRAHFCKVMQ